MRLQRWTRDVAYVDRALPTNLATLCTDHRYVPNSTFLYRPQRRCGKVVFLHQSVILFTGWGCAIPPVGRPPWADPPSPRLTLRSACWDTVNKWAVYILLALVDMSSFCEAVDTPGFESVACFFGYVQWIP